MKTLASIVYAFFATVAVGGIGVVFWIIGKAVNGSLGL